MLTNAGIAYIRGRIEANTTPLFGATLYLACTSDANATAPADTTLPGELTTNGLARAAVTAAHTAGTNVWTYQATFTYSGSTLVTVNKLGLFDAATGGNLIEEAVITPVSFNTAGDNVAFYLALNIPN